jgi:CDP-4-dehydro-6-deoxyglucose reductase
MSFTVTLQPSGHRFTVAAEERILTAGLAAGFSLPYSCRMGVCTSCLGRVLQGGMDLGEVSHAYLSEQQRQQGYALLCQERPLRDLVVELQELPRLVPRESFPAIVRRISKATVDVAIVDLRLPLHLNLRFAAGQYVDIALPTGKKRSYSMANPPAPEGVIDLQFHIRHMPGGAFTDRVFSGLKERDRLECTGPLGSFCLREESDKPIVLIASGTGYAPIRSLILDAFRRKIPRPMTLYWGARVRRDLYSFEEPQRWASEQGAFKFVPVLSEALATDDWTGRTGFVHRAVMEDFPDLSNYQVYACGAPAMVDAARRDLVAQCRLPSGEFFADSFVTEADVAAAVAAEEGVS